MYDLLIPPPPPPTLPSPPLLQYHYLITTIATITTTTTELPLNMEGSQQYFIIRSPQLQVVHPCICPSVRRFVRTSVSFTPYRPALVTVTDATRLVLRHPVYGKQDINVLFTLYSILGHGKIELMRCAVVWCVCVCGVCWCGVCGVVW